MLYVAAVVGALAAVAWGVAIVSWIRALGELAEGVTATQLLVNGLRTFDSNNFNERGKIHQRRFLRAAGLCFLLAAIALVFGAAGNAASRAP